MDNPVEAAQHYRSQIDGHLEDGRLGLKYVLLRLSTVGLTAKDQISLRHLITKACGDEDVSEAVDHILKAKSSSELAVAIAQIVGAATTARKGAALGAVLGAHGTVFNFGPNPEAPVAAAIRGAVTGASTAAAMALIETKAMGLDLQRFLTAD
jgi:hypothetical protein